MMITQKIVEAMIAHAEREAPIEACGYLGGLDNGITAIYEMKNVDGREDHFSFDPQEQFAVHKKVRQAGLKIIGVYHSHPATPARPSAEDIKLAYDPAALYVIVSLLATRPDVKAFWIRQGMIDEETLIIEGKL
ncbi:MAG: M67 family metallopeptidase [Deltaproteobacteria bacterium]